MYSSCELPSPARTLLFYSCFCVSVQQDLPVSWAHKDYNSSCMMTVEGVDIQLSRASISGGTLLSYSWFCIGIQQNLPVRCTITVEGKAIQLPASPYDSSSKPCPLNSGKDSDKIAV